MITGPVCSSAIEKAAAGAGGDLEASAVRPWNLSPGGCRTLELVSLRALERRETLPEGEPGRAVRPGPPPPLDPASSPITLKHASD
jgi:hypothetical protein